MINGHSTIVLATGNRGKIRELRRLLAVVPVELKSLQDFEEIRDVDETGNTFEENAVLKARGFAMQTSELSLADDSGLEVAALGNEPGIRSARFAGPETSYDVKMRKLLDMLDATGDRERKARFVCVMALADPTGRVIHSAEGVCRGSIAEMPSGSGGFGYDPIFIPEGYDRTFGELAEDVKQTISHRARAAELIIRYLLHFTKALT
jgi:XTP/dITP diphosphohydrolase